MTVLDIVLTEDELRTVTQVLASLVPRHQAMAFGSRVRAGAAAAKLKAHADLDIALIGPPLEPHDMFALRNAFSESDLPFGWTFPCTTTCHRNGVALFIGQRCGPESPGLRWASPTKSSPASSLR